MLTLLTASHRNPSGLKTLYEQVRSGLGPDLQWIIQDSGVCDASRHWGECLVEPYVKFVAEPDSGIYDALNRALSRIQTPFYLVVGSDDSLDIDALQAIVAYLRSPAASQPDVITFPVRMGDSIRKRQPLWPSQFNVLQITSSHSVGTIIRSDLHDAHGPYDTRYQILADSLFLRRVQLAGGTFEHRDHPIPGRFSTNGVSRTNYGRLMLENYSYNVECGSSRVLQSIMLLVRLLAYRPRSLI